MAKGGMRIATVRCYFLALALFTLGWWPLSHWFYPDWYHRMLGFSGYDYALVKIIGTTGVLPVLGMFFVARDPLRNRDFVVALLAFSFLLAGTYVFLIEGHGFPPLEYMNVALLLVNAMTIAALYPWRCASRSNQDYSSDV